MDILISSNLERFLFEITGHEGGLISSWLEQLSIGGEFRIDEESRCQISEILAAGYANEAQTLKTIREVYQKYGYTVDTHTGVGLKVYNDYMAVSGDQTLTVIDATANPFKFNQAVLEAIKGREAIDDKDEFTILQELSEVSKMELHSGLKELDTKSVKHTRVIQKDEIKNCVEEILGLR